MVTVNNINSFEVNIIKMREQFNFPTLHCSEDHCYGNDYSFFVLQHMKLNGIYFKQVYFIGATLKKMLFMNCHFSCCKFVATEMELCHFLGCNFDACTFYNTNSENIKMLNCELDASTKRTNSKFQ